MDWTIAIHRNRIALLSIIAMLMKSIGLVKGAMLTTLPFYLHRKVLLILRPAEAAVRRLIVIAAHDMKLRGFNLTPSGRGVSEADGEGELVRQKTRDERQRKSSFCLIEPLKIFGDEHPDYASFHQVFHDENNPHDTRRVPAEGLGRRLFALQNALDNIEKQALRLTRWYAIRNVALKQNLPHRASPMRPGLPPYHKKRPRHEVETLLSECHGLALYARDRRDSS